MNTIDVMKQGKAALKELVAQTEGRYFSLKHDHVALQNAREAVRLMEQAIKQEEQQPAPVKTYSGGKAWPVQTEWVGLTEDEVDEIWRKLLHRDSRALAIEQRLKEKNSKD